MLHLFCYFRYSAWPQDALIRVGERFLSDIDLEADMKAACVVICQKFHEDIRDLSDR